ncbi:hypothetical protein D3C78_1295510 [compost metagenome]
MDVQRGQGFAAFGAGGDGELMLAQVFQFAIQSVMATGPQPERGVMAVASLGAEVELDRQLQVMHAVAVTQQHVQLAQCMPFATDRQVGRQQFDPGGMPHGKLPQAFVIQPQSPGAGLGQPILQCVAVLVELMQPMLQLLRGAYPVAAGQRMTLRPWRRTEHGRCEDDPRQIAHLRVVQLVGQLEQIGK